ncbi:Gp49 family protein [Acidovorax sp. LjRoot74]|uniref:Gp49 family protein n=1 Tax=Acidovorax sp. LjRoot74 TaxID=3342337 RepID=UPI003ECC8D44
MTPFTYTSKSAMFLIACSVGSLIACAYAFHDRQSAYGFVGMILCFIVLAASAVVISFERIVFELKLGAVGIPVVDPGPDSLEREIQAKAANGPRVTPADIEAEIAAEFYFTAADGVLGQSEMGTRPAAWTNLDQVTICTLVLRNGAKVLGVNYGAIDRAQHDAAKGRESARAAAVEMVWVLLGFRLRDELARPVLTEADAAADLAGMPRPS